MTWIFLKCTLKTITISSYGQCCLRSHHHACMSFILNHHLCFQWISLKTFRKIFQNLKNCAQCCMVGLAKVIEHSAAWLALLK